MLPEVLLIRAVLRYIHTELFASLRLYTVWAIQAMFSYSCVTRRFFWSLLGRLFYGWRTLGWSAHSETQRAFGALPHLSDYNHWLRTGWMLRLSREVSSYSHYGGFYYTQPAFFIHKPWSGLKQSPAVCLAVAEACGGSARSTFARGALLPHYGWVRCGQRSSRLTLCPWAARGSCRA